MDIKRVPLALALVFVCCGFGVLVTWFWPLQSNLDLRFPWWMKVLSFQIGCWGIYISAGLLFCKILPTYHRWRITGSLAGNFGFLVNLLLERNSGSIILVNASFAMMAWSWWRNQIHHSPITASRREFYRAVITLAAWYVVGAVIATWLWPVNATTQYQGWYWEYVAWAGAVIYFTAGTMVETHVVEDIHAREYLIVYGIGSVILLFSYLGQFSWLGLMLNIAFSGLLYGPLVYKRFCR